MNHFTTLSTINAPPKDANERRTGARSDASSAAEPDRHLVAVDDDRNLALAAAEGQHLFQIGRVLLDVDVFELNVPPLIVVTGGLRVGSRVLAENVDHESIVRRIARARIDGFR